MRLSMCVVFWLVSQCGMAPLDAREDDAGPDVVLAGHSYHGEAFNEGPRQRAYLMDGLGRSEFPVSTPVPKAQEFFNQGVDQLHGFWYFEAERSFRQVAVLDPDCVMAYWGLAMANENNEDRAENFIAVANEKLTLEKRAVSPREKLYLESLTALYDQGRKDEKKRAAEMVSKLEQIVLQFPDDIEAKAFLVCQLWKNERKGIKITSHVAVNALLDQIFDQEPAHPAHHYRIHLWDYKDAKVALESAARCGPSLPNIAHMWHMPGHIYSKLKRYEDAVWQQEASARVDHRNMMGDWVMPDQIHNFAHNNEWCIRNLIHVGRVDDAIDLATNMISLPRHPKYNVLGDYGSANYGRKRLFQVLSTFERWDQLIVACHASVLEPTEDRLEQVKRLRFLGRAYFRSGQTGKGRAILSKLKRELETAQTDQEKSQDQARKDESRISQRQRQVWDLLVGIAPHDWQKQMQRLGRGAARRNERERVKESVARAGKKLGGQINVIKRAIDEMEGHELVVAEKFDLAADKLKAAGGVDAMYRASLRFRAGDADRALKDAKKYVDDHPSEVQPQAQLTWLLWRMEKRDEAVASLQRLRAISATMDGPSPVFQRLEPVVKHAELPAEWRSEVKTADDIGARPDLDSLGPFRWQPNFAPSWELVDSREQLISLDDYRGKPMVLIFYLGHGCLHCAEQLQEFGPKAYDFTEAGIELVAVSTDDREGLKKSIEGYGPNPLPIQLIANPDMNVFKQYRAYDEFEDQPLHGTFLIDGTGRVRWQDISYEPFMDADFLLEESKRLLSQPSNVVAK